MSGFEQEPPIHTIFQYLRFSFEYALWPKTFPGLRARVLQKKGFFVCFCFVLLLFCFAFYTTSILVKVTKIIWWSIWIQMDFNRNFTYFLYHHSFHSNATKTFFFLFHKQPGTFTCKRTRCKTFPFISNTVKISGPNRSF